MEVRSLVNAAWGDCRPSLSILEFYRYGVVSVGVFQRNGKALLIDCGQGPTLRLHAHLGTFAEFTMTPKGVTAQTAEPCEVLLVYRYSVVEKGLVIAAARTRDKASDYT